MPSATMTLRITGSVAATVEATHIQYHPNVLNYAHGFVCSGVVQVTGAIRSAQTLHRNGALQAHCPVHNVNNGTEIRVNWSNGNTTCNVYIN